MNNKFALGALGVALLAIYNAAQPDIARMRSQGHEQADKLRAQSVQLRSAPTDQVERDQSKILNLDKQARNLEKQSYGPSMAWLDRLANANADRNDNRVKLDFNVLSSMMVAGLAANMKSQVANLLWMKSDEYWHNGMLTRQVPLMEAVVTLDPQFIDAWSTAGWHWSYNIYADIEQDPRYKKMSKEQSSREIARAQDRAVEVGLDYLNRGAQMNPDTYRLWFEDAHTREHKAGYNDEDTVRLYRIAHSQSDARNIIRDIKSSGGKTEQRVEQGMDLVGRQIGHLYESRPDFDKALDQYGKELLKATPQERELLNACGGYWGRYSSLYPTIIDVYTKGDPTVKAQVRKLVPDVERLILADKTRDKMEVRENGNGGQPTGAYVSIVARYIPTWKLVKANRFQEAIDTIIGVMNANPKYHLQGLPVLAKIMEIRGDAPQVIAAQLKQTQQYERDSSQDIGLHLLATLYGKAEAQAANPSDKAKFARLAYETWFRSRARNTLDFYAKRQTRLYQAKYGYTDADAQKIADDVKASRKNGNPNAAPAAPPNVGSAFSAPNHDHDGDGKPDHEVDAHDQGQGEGDTASDAFNSLNKQP